MIGEIEGSKRNNIIQCIGHLCRFVGSFPLSRISRWSAIYQLERMHRETPFQSNHRNRKSHAKWPPFDDVSVIPTYAIISIYPSFDRFISLIIHPTDCLINPVTLSQYSVINEWSINFRAKSRRIAFLPLLRSHCLFVSKASCISFIFLYYLHSSS